MSDVLLTFTEHEALPVSAWSFLVRRRADGVCEGCKKKRRLHAHHADGNSGNNCLANGVALCRGCQRKWDVPSRSVRRKRETEKVRRRRQFAEAVAKGELRITTLSREEMRARGYA